MSRRVVVTGVGLVSSLGIGTEETWRAIRDGRPGISRIEQFDPTEEEVVRKHYLGNMKGWIFFMINLKSVLEGGIDMRNRKEELKNVLTA